VFKTISNLHNRDDDYPERVWKLRLYNSILEGTFYDPLQYEFWEAQSSAGETISLSKRKPSVRYNVCRLVVQDSISMLFGDERFPIVDCSDEDTLNTMKAIVKECRLSTLMLDVALRGSIGSAAVLMRVLKNRLFFKRLDTWFLTPEWNQEEPDTLLTVTEKYKVRGRDLKAQGYIIPTENLLIDYWFMRRWTTAAEEWYVPWTKDQEAKDDFSPQIDEDRTVQHNLEFVPIIWFKNLPGGDDIDGECTFRLAIDTSIELDYQLSQAGRGLKYSSDPELLLKDPAMGAGGDIIKGQGNAIVVGEKGDAKWLEISGDAVHAIIDYSRALREMALESIRGNRSNADRISAAQSGRAMELMHQALIWLAGELRVHYGEDGLLPMMRMIVAASKKYSLKVAGEDIGELSDEPLSLRWGAWFSPTPDDKVGLSNALKIGRDAGNMSQKTAVKALAPVYDVEDEPQEIRDIDNDVEAAVERAIRANAQQQIRKSGDAVI
jgi:hypothetical protein